MEPSIENPGDSTTNPVGTVELDGKPVAFESYKKAVSEAKNAKERARQLEEELRARENKELEEKGQYQQLVEQMRKELTETKSTLQKERESFLWSKVESAVSTEAVKHGCTDPKKLIRLLDESDFTLLKSDNGQIQNETLSQLIDKAKKENGFLFKQPAVQINDTIPVNGEPKLSKPTQLSKEEIIERLKAKE